MTLAELNYILRDRDPNTTELRVEISDPNATLIVHREATILERSDLSRSDADRWQLSKNEVLICPTDD